jgi:uncharacterized protein YbaR (Trm112 family)
MNIEEIVKCPICRGLMTKTNTTTIPKTSTIQVHEAGDTWYCSRCNTWFKFANEYEIEYLSKKTCPYCGKEQP